MRPSASGGGPQSQENFCTVLLVFQIARCLVVTVQLTQSSLSLLRVSDWMFVDTYRHPSLKIIHEQLQLASHSRSVRLN